MIVTDLRCDKCGWEICVQAQNRPLVVCKRCERFMGYVRTPANVADKEAKK